MFTIRHRRLIANGTLQDVFSGLTLRRNQRLIPLAAHRNRKLGNLHRVPQESGWLVTDFFLLDCASYGGLARGAANGRNSIGCVSIFGKLMLCERSWTSLKARALQKASVADTTVRQILYYLLFANS